MQQVLFPFTLVLHFCSKVFYNPPEQSLLQSLYEEQLFANWPLELNTTEEQEALDRLQAANLEHPMDETELHLEHIRLFSGPEPLARPWESVWREKEQLLFGEKTMQVRNLYAKWGLEIHDRGHSPEDHFALELAFIVHLLNYTSTDKKDSSIAALKHFLDEHLLTWAEPCMQAVQSNAQHCFYSALSVLCLAALRQLYAII